MVNTAKHVGGVSLHKLLDGAEILGASDIVATSCCNDSRRVQPGDLFVALPGTEHDGHDFVREARLRGASAVLAERLVPLGGLPLCIVPDVRIAFGQLCQRLAGDPSRQLKVIGVTGTNGKTTTTHLAAGVLTAAGCRVGTMGTLGLCDTTESAPPSLTTPSPTVLAQWLGNMLAGGCSHAVMEVSSHGLTQSRVAGIEFDAACFTNIRRDHLDYHGSLLNYRRAKERLLEHLAPDGMVVLNADDQACAALVSRLHHPVLTIGIKSEAEITATILERHQSEQTFLLHAESETAVVRTRMIGDHHVYNCLIAAALGLGYGIDLATTVRGLESVEQVPGRLERIDCGQGFGVFVDYAHTPDALQTSLAALREVTPGRLLCVFGAGGDRDRRKRPLMGAAVERLADLAVITTDNPRSEDPAAIADDVRAGFNRRSQAHVQLDREQAIHQALHQAQPDDCVLIAGKGHEDYQVVGKQRLYFDDRQVARDYLYRAAAEETSAWAKYA